VNSRLPNQSGESQRGATPEVQEAQQWYTATEFAALLRVTPRLIYYYADKREIQSDKSTRPYRFRASVDFIANHRHRNSLSEKPSTYEADVPRLSRLWRFRTRWQEFVDEPNRSRLVRWLGVAGSVASLLGFYLAFFPRPLSDDPVAQINNYMNTLLQAQSSSQHSSNDELVKQVATSIEATSESAGDIDRVVSAVQAYLPRRNPAILRTTAVLVLAELGREQKKGNLKKPKAGFLRFADLSSLDLHDCNLTDADLTGADLTDANLRQCRIEYSDLSDTKLIRTNLDSTVSGASTFDGAIMKNCTFNKAILGQSSMRKVTAEHCSFIDATIFAINFEGSSFLQCTFHNANIVASSFKGIHTSGATFESGPTSCDRGEGIDFSTAHFNWKPTLKDNEAVKTTLFPSLNKYYMEFAPQDRTTFSEAILQHANFSRTCLQQLNFTRTQLKGAVFDGANLDRADLNQSDLECASFRGALLKNARNLNTVKNARRMDIAGSVITNVQASTLQSKGAVLVMPGTFGAPFVDTAQCEAVVADIASPLPKPSDASQYETVIDLVPYADAPTELHAALQFFSRILEQKPNDVAALEKRSKAYYQLGELDKAIVDLQHVLVLEPDNLGASCNLGLVYNSKNEPREALKFLSAALEKGIKDRDLYALCINNSGISHMLLGKADEALKEFDRAIVLDPSQANSYANRAWAHASLKQYELAIQDYTRVIKIDPKFIDAYRRRSSAYRAIGQNDLADADERIALGLQNERNR
jgi:uncharacterized protein YjbI with pentapeptide repeats/Tfp pilus assembly protein PilF